LGHTERWGMTAYLTFNPDLAPIILGRAVPNMLGKNDKVKGKGKGTV